MKKKMNWFYWGVVALVVLTGLTVSIYFGIRPRPVPKINWSEFSGPESFAAAVSQRIGFELRDKNILFLGVMPESSMDGEIWGHFLKSQHQFGAQETAVIIETQLPHKIEFLQLVQNLNLRVEEVDFKSDFSRVIQGMPALLKNFRQIIFILPSIYVTHTLKSNPMDKFKLETGLNPIAMTLTRFPISTEEESQMEIPCAGEADIDGTGKLGCLILMKAKLNYRKKKIPGKYYGFIDQIGQLEYLLGFRQIVQ